MSPSTASPIYAPPDYVSADHSALLRAEHRNDLKAALISGLRGFVCAFFVFCVALGLYAVLSG